MYGFAGSFDFCGEGYDIPVIPVPSGVYEDGGTKAYTALTYKIVDWNRMTNTDEIYDATSVYFFPDNFKSIDSLWREEKEKVIHSFHATVLEINGSAVLVQPVEGESELRSSDKISFETADLEEIDAEVGSVVSDGYVKLTEQELNAPDRSGFTVVEWGGTKIK